MRGGLIEQPGVDLNAEDRCARTDHARTLPPAGGCRPGQTAFPSGSDRSKNSLISSRWRSLTRSKCWSSASGPIASAVRYRSLIWSSFAAAASGTSRGGAGTAISAGGGSTDPVTLTGLPGGRAGSKKPRGASTGAGRGTDVAPGRITGSGRVSVSSSSRSAGRGSGRLRALSGPGTRSASFSAYRDDPVSGETDGKSAPVRERAESTGPPWRSRGSGCQVRSGARPCSGADHGDSARGDSCRRGSGRS